MAVVKSSHAAPASSARPIAQFLTSRRSLFLVVIAVALAAKAVIFRAERSERTQSESSPPAASTVSLRTSATEKIDAPERPEEETAGAAERLEKKKEAEQLEPKKEEASEQPKEGTTDAAERPEPKKDGTSEQLKEMGLVPIYSDRVTDPWKATLYQRLDRIRVVCGELCQLNDVETLEAHQKPLEGATLPMTAVLDVDCPAILACEDIDAGDLSVPRIPEELLDFFTLGGAYHVSDHELRKDIYLNGESETKLWKTGSVWKEDDVNAAVVEAAEGTLKGSYGVNATFILRDRMSKIDMKGKSVLVIGSSHPWVEAIVLHHGAAKVTTLEYGKIFSEHPQIVTMTPAEFRSKYLKGELEEFDGVVSHSSVEHSGLGRYGDALNPWGDILTVARAWCVTKPGGFLYLGLPTGKDMVFSNWHRTYGKIRWPLVTVNWRPTEQAGEEELERGLWKAQDYGGFGYIYRKDEEDTSEENA